MQGGEIDMAGIIDAVATNVAAYGMKVVGAVAVLVQDTQDGGLVGVLVDLAEDHRVSAGLEPLDDHVERRRSRGWIERTPWRRATEFGLRRARDDLGAAAPRGRSETRVQEPSSISDWSSSGIPPVLRLLKTLPGGVSPFSHSAQ